MSERMDAIDARQQKEIEDLRNKNNDQDKADLAHFWMFAILILWMVFLTGGMALSLTKNGKIEIKVVTDAR